MPITRMQFELGIDADLQNWMKTIFKFLEKNKSEAYSREELAAEFDATDLTWEDQMMRNREGKWQEWDARRQRFSLALERLVELNVVSEREVAGVRYYATGRYALEDILSGKVDPYKRAS